MLKNAGVIAERRAILEALGLPEHLLKDGQLIPPATLVATLTVLERLGFTRREVMKMMGAAPVLMTLSPETVTDTVSNLLCWNFTPGQIWAMGLHCPQQLFASTERTDRVVRNLLSKGFAPTDVARMSAMTASTLWNTPEITNEKLEVFKNFGFSDWEIVVVFSMSPRFLKQGKDTTAARLERLERRKIPRASVRAMVMHLPSILFNEPERLDEMFDVLESAGVDPVARPNLFAFSPSLLRGRVVHFKRQGIPMGYLFQSNPIIQKRYGVTREQMIALDPGAEAFRGLSVKTAA